jgi:pimeloyl-ACP methyl ester carboxylesterase
MSVHTKGIGSPDSSLAEIAKSVGPSKIDIAYERFGDSSSPPLLLVMGLATQMIAWHDDFVAALVATGLHVIRFDNRDIGLSTHMANAPAPNFAAVVAGDLTTASYNLSDMAADTVGLLDALGIQRAHLVGASMGGFISQTIAIEHPSRVRSLTSIMSSTGDRTVGQLAPEAYALFGVPPAKNRDEAIARAIDAVRLIGSPAYPFDEAMVRDRAGRSYDRAYDPIGIVRQGIAVVASGDRTERLKKLDVPALVIHGTADKMCDLSGGRATAAAIPGAKLVTFEGMGHDLPRALWPQFIEEISALVRRAEAR